eukprot:643860-Hanusia_phi.AAC.4
MARRYEARTRRLCVRACCRSRRLTCSLPASLLCTLGELCCLPRGRSCQCSRRAARAALGNFGENMDEQKEKKRMLQESEDYFGGEDESYPDPKLDCADFQLIGEDSPRYGAEVGRCCKQLDEILIANGEVKSREGRLVSLLFSFEFFWANVQQEILKRLLENDEAFYARSRYLLLAQLVPDTKPGKFKVGRSARTSHRSCKTERSKS